MLKEYKDLTKAQVEALLECFDFLANGYIEQSCFEVDGLWIIQMKHKRTLKVIRVFIHQDRYRIQVAGHTRKKVLFTLGSDRYRLAVNSDASVQVIRTKPGAG